jgi:hypothetical protein
MRRAGTGAQISNTSNAEAAPRDDGISKIEPIRRGKHRGYRSASKSSTVDSASSSSYPLLFFIFALLLVMADMFYLYRLSSQAMVDDPTRKSDLKGTHLSRVAGSVERPRNRSITGFGITNYFREGQVPFQMLRPPLSPPLPENHQDVGKEHYQNQINAQQDRNPAKQSPDLLHDQALNQGLYNLDDKGPILKILQQAGLEIQDLDQQSIDELPTWSQIQRLYGKEPRIVGLETCEAFREGVDARTRFFGVAGAFNSGTNLGTD